VCARVFAVNGHLDGDKETVINRFCLKEGKAGYERKDDIFKSLQVNLPKSVKLVILLSSFVVKLGLLVVS
jgi:hypothetical protein